MDAAFLERGRVAAESLMTDTCRITKPGTGKGPFNEGTGQYDRPAPVTVYEGPCRIPRRLTGAVASDATAGEATWQVGEYPLSIPLNAAGSAAVAAGMTVVFLTSATDPSLVDRTFGIVAPARQTAAVARRFKMKEVVS